MCAILYMNSDVLLLLSGFTHAIRYARNWVEPIKLQSFIHLLCHIHVDSRLTIMCLSMLCHIQANKGHYYEGGGGVD